MDLLRIATSGSVDDGKSTLIGRLLYETKQIPEDKLQAIESASFKRGLDFLDLSLLTDGLIAERAQGITIDVAHIYFHTPERKFIIADTPGHVEYTRNMVTGASTAQASIILIDARKGILEQTKRHLFIAHLLQLSRVIVAVNKMDLVDYEEEVFRNIQSEFERMIERIGFQGKVHFLPMSALKGEGVTQFLGYQKWFEGPSLLDLLTELPLMEEEDKEESFRFQVQHVIRPKSSTHPDFRGFAGSLHTGETRVGQRISNARSGQSSTIKSMEKWGKAINSSKKDLALTLILEDEIDLRRGDILLHENEVASTRKQVKAELCWLNGASHQAGSTYILQQGTARTKCKIKSINKSIDLLNLEWKAGGELESNSISEIELQLASPLHMDPYSSVNKLGAFILIHPQSMLTLAVGFPKG